ncbi:MAG: GNAT family N-acetyltransferase [Planctomycetes bacterium]|nr:GNAT family N-acetyltransferase [Planctomycetota bacterium]
MPFPVRKARPADLDLLAPLRAALWPDASLAEHRDELARILEGRPLSTLPLVAMVAECAGGISGFVEVGLRSHADGCDPGRPVGYVEGWFVEPAHRRKGVGRALLAAAEAWCREQGATEIASDTWIDNGGSQRAHEALGFQEVDRCVNYRKRIGDAPHARGRRST